MSIGNFLWSVLAIFVGFWKNPVDALWTTQDGSHRFYSGNRLAGVIRVVCGLCFSSSGILIATFVEATAVLIPGIR